MFSLLKILKTFVLKTFSFDSKSLIFKKIMILIILSPLTWGYCLFLKNQECRVRKLIVDNDDMTFPYKIGINRCIGSCNNENNPYFKICLPDSIKNITVKSFKFVN